MYLPVNQLKIQPVPLSFENWLSMLKKPLPERPAYSIDNGAIQIGQVIGEFLGVPIDLDEYYNQLFDYATSAELNLQVLSEDSLDKSIQNTQFQAIQRVLNRNQEQHLSINRFAAFLDGEQLLLKSSIPSVHRRLRESMIETLELFAKSEDNGLNNPELRRVLVDMVKWTQNHIGPVIESADPQKEMPKYLWYGGGKKSHQYFLYYLLSLGCDLVIFHPKGNDILEGIVQQTYFIHRFQQQADPEPFPTEKRSRKATVAYRASKEIETILNQEGSGLYKPWQLREYTPSSITLKTTYDELFIISQEIAMVRPEFHVENGQVKIPAIFAKVQGVSKNRKEYWEHMHSLNMQEPSLFIRKLPFSIPSTSDFRFHYRDALGKDGLVSPEKVMQAHYWPYSFLPSGLQKGIASAVREICEKPMLKALPIENMEDIKIFLFTQAMFMPKNIIQLLEQFDYSQAVPKLIIFNNDRNAIEI